MPRPPISATIITLNEEQNIGRTLQSLSWVDDVVVVDSGSTDKTQQIAQELGARVIHNPWPGYGKQKNFAQSQAKHDWVLNIDADEVIPQRLADEISQILAASPDPQAGYAVARKTYYLGKWIRHGGWYPNYVLRLANRQHSQWTEPGVHEALQVKGTVNRLDTPLHHFTFSSIEEQILTNLRYSRAGFFDLRSRGYTPSVVRLMLKPIGKFLETYILKRGFLDGLAGLIISINAAHSMFLKHAYLFEERFYEDPNHRQ